MVSWLRAALIWRIKTPFYYGWLILAMAFLAAFTATGVSQVVLGGIQIFITEDTGWERTTISVAVTSGTWLSGPFAPFLGRLADRYGPRWLMAAGLIAAGASFLWLGGVQVIWQFFAAYILGRAVSNPTLVGVVPRTAAVNFFRRRRNVVLALMSTYRPVGGAINIQIISYIAAHRGWRAAYRYWGIASLLLVVPFILIMRRRPEDIGMLPDGASPVEMARSDSLDRRSTTAGEPDVEFSWTAREAWRSRAYWLIGATAVMGTIAGGTTGYSLVPFLHEEAGLTKSQAVGVLSFGTILSISNLGWGFLADVITPRRCLIICLVVTAAMLVFLMRVDSLALALAFALIWGIFSGSVGSLEQMVLAQYYGRGSYGTIVGVLNPFQTFGLGIGPIFATVFQQTVGNYIIFYSILVSIHLAGALFIFLARQPDRPLRPPPDPSVPATQ